MAETYLTLLQEGNRVTANAFDKINNAITTHAKMAQQQSQFEAEMTFKGVAMAENIRMNDAQIANMRQQNYIAGRRQQLDEAMMPLKYQTANLQLENARLNLEAGRAKQHMDIFGNIVADHDEQMGYELLKKFNVDEAQEYLNLKTKYAAQVASGVPFDNDAFTKDKNKIMSKYVDVDPGDQTWSAANRHLATSISPTLGKLYDMQNPPVQRSKNALASSFLSAPDKDAAGFIGNYGTLYQPDETGYLNAGRSYFQENERRIDEAYRRSTSLQSQLASIPDTPLYAASREGVKAQIDQLIDQAGSLSQINQRMQLDFSRGDFMSRGVPLKYDDPNSTVNPDGSPKRPGNGDAFPEGAIDKSQTVLGMGKQGDAQGQGMFSKLHSVVSELVDEKRDTEQKTELAGIGTKWFGDNRMKTEMNTASKTKFKDHIRYNIDNNPEISNDFESRFNPTRINNLISKIPDEATAPISPHVWELIKSSKLFTDSAVGKLGGITDQVTPMVRFGKKRGGMMTPFDAGRIKDFSEIKAITNNISNKTEREEAEKEIYAALLTATISQALIAK